MIKFIYTMQFITRIHYTTPYLSKAIKYIVCNSSLGRFLHLEYSNIHIPKDYERTMMLLHKCVSSSNNVTMSCRRLHCGYFRFSAVIRQGHTQRMWRLSDKES
jgi:hypothetical protein